MVQFAHCTSAILLELHNYKIALIVVLKKRQAQRPAFISD